MSAVADPPTPPRVYTIPAGWSFVDSLALGIRRQAGEEPESLARVSVLLPTRRACRALREAFLRTGGGRPVLLPRMLALGDVDEDELMIGASGLLGEGDLAVPPVVPGLRRQLLLTRLIQARPDTETSPDQAARLARELARLLDQVHTERGDFSNLGELVPEAFAAHWQVTLDFLKILTDVWPELLAAEASLDPADRRNRLLEARAHLWQAVPPADPVIAAGSTGSIPATADLLAVVARLPAGAVVLPGLDRSAPDDLWNHLEPHHPQYGMAQLIARMGVERHEVADWPDGPTGATPPERTRFMNAALTPAGAEAPSGEHLDDPDTALNGVTRIDCPSPHEEAATVALLMRRALEAPGRTAALVTPDRGLARRVTAELKRWEIEVDDSAGVPLAQTPPGGFLRLVARVALEGLAPVPLLALLKHPLAAAGYAPSTLRRLVRRLEVAALRGPRPGPGIDGLRAVLAGKDGELTNLVERVEACLAPLLDLDQRATHPLGELTRKLVGAAESLATSNDLGGAEALWAGEAGEAAAAFAGELMEWGDATELTAAQFAPLLETIMAGRVVRPRYGTHPRLAIWGPLEARLQRADLLIMGGLNEGTWPPEPPASPWMSRPMMTDFGLPLPKRRIGLSAHDFAQGFAAPEVVLTRAERVDGTPTVPCRWLQRIDNLLARLDRTDALDPKEPWLDWVAALDRPDAARPVRPPRPAPPAEARPVKLSVTQVETLVRDPYAVYARHVLGLRPLDPIDADPGAADRGSIIHHTLDEFIARHPDVLPDKAEQELLGIGEEIFDELLARPGVRAFWWPRFQRIARWFVANERARRTAGYRTVATEVEGVLEFQGFRHGLTLTARADRIDRRFDVGLSIIDYKTGQPPTDKQIVAGLASQLPLEAAIAEAGGFEGLTAETVANLTYMRLSGGRQAGLERAVKLDMAETVADAVAGLTRLMHKFEDPATPYLSQPRPMFLGRFGDYDHLSRVKEWRGRGGGEESR